MLSVDLGEFLFKKVCSFLVIKDPRKLRDGVLRFQSIHSSSLHTFLVHILFAH